MNGFCEVCDRAGLLVQRHVRRGVVHVSKTCLSCKHTVTEEYLQTERWRRSA